MSAARGRSRASGWRAEYDALPVRTQNHVDHAVRWGLPVDEPAHARLALALVEQRRRVLRRRQAGWLALALVCLALAIAIDALALRVVLGLVGLAALSQVFAYSRARLARAELANRALIDEG